MSQLDRYDRHVPLFLGSVPAAVEQQVDIRVAGILQRQAGFGDAGGAISAKRKAPEWK
jgi:hypothetical protein